MRRILAVLLAGAGLAGCATAPPPATPAPAPVAAAPADTAAAERMKRFQYLYGSGEAGAVSIQTYHALVDAARERTRTRPADSVILAEGSTLNAPRFGRNA